jgi:hypothetical protein
MRSLTLNVIHLICRVPHTVGYALDRHEIKRHDIVLLLSSSSSSDSYTIKGEGKLKL